LSAGSDVPRDEYIVTGTIANGGVPNTEYEVQVDVQVDINGVMTVKPASIQPKFGLIGTIIGTEAQGSGVNSCSPTADVRIDGTLEYLLYDLLPHVIFIHKCPASHSIYVYYLLSDWHRIQFRQFI
jgi:hypothetical protein